MLSITENYHFYMLFYISKNVLFGDDIMYKSKFLRSVSFLFISLVISTTNLLAEDMIEENIKIINAAQADVLIERNKDNPEFIILDVRTSSEFNSGHIANALNIDYKSSDFKDAIGKLDRDKTYLTYCRSGRRSAKASEIMLELGFEKIYMINGGIFAWDKANLPTTQ